MASDEIVEAVDISGNGGLSIGAGKERGAPDQFSFQRLEECFDHGIVKAIALARHEDSNAGGTQFGLVVDRTLLAAAVGVVNEAGCGYASKRDPTRIWRSSCKREHI